MVVGAHIKKNSSSGSGELKKSTPSQQLAQTVLTPDVVKQLGGEQNLKWNNSGAFYR